ncbi:hypothetical protein L1049_001097 [Liquidambar formosana]|uniref:YTH domain-containing family protein n=1 Tax=Liquidambar formosana TaxID=63359 RepID=A0AAP0R857_LIQFO
MEESVEHEQDRIESAGERPLGLENLTEQPLLHKNERIVSENPALDAATIWTSRDVNDQPESSDAGGSLGTVYPLDAYAPFEQMFYYGGFDNNTGGYSHYVNSDGLQVVSPVMYNDPSIVYHPGYGFNPEMAYGQYSTVATPPSSVMVDGQLYSPQQIPFAPPYYPQTVAPSLPQISSAVPVPQTELLTPESSVQEGVSDDILFGPGSGYFVHFGSFGGGGLSGNPGSTPGFYNFLGEFGSGKPLSNELNPSDLSPLTSPAAYPQRIGILGSYEHYVGQRPMHGFGLASSSSGGRYSHGGSYQSSKFGSASISRLGPNDRNRLTFDKGRRRERDRDSICISHDSHDISSNHNRGPRALKPKAKSPAEEGYLSAISKNDTSTSEVCLDLYNRPDFVTDCEGAKFFIIKSFSEDNVHRSIKYGVWASTPLGNRKLDAAYHEAKGIKGNCPVYLFFSVNASAQFCGVAEMIGPVDFQKDADYWQQDRWNGQFPVQWHIVKDVPNNRFRHVLLENNENKPVTHSRDTQEVKLELGIEMLKIFKNHDARTSILDDFGFYDERERALQDRKARQKASSNTDDPVSLSNDSASSTTDVLVSVANDSASFTTNAPASLAKSINQMSDSFAQTLKLDMSSEEVTTGRVVGH